MPRSFHCVAIACAALLAACASNAPRYGDDGVSAAAFEQRYIQDVNETLALGEATLRAHGKCNECPAEIVARAEKSFGELYTWPRAAAAAGERFALPRALAARPPRHPTSDGMGAVEGSTWVAVGVNEDGSVGRFEFLVETDERIQAVVAQSLREWRFEPASHEGERRRSVLLVPFTFRLSTS